MDLLNMHLERDDLADRLGGGLPPGTLIMIEGVNGAGKSLLAQRLAYGLAANGHTCSFVSTELTTAGFLEQMSSLRYEVAGPLLEERLVFVPVYPMFGARAPRYDMLRRILKARLLYSKEVIVFDTFSKFLADHLRVVGHGYRSMEQVEAVVFLFKRLTSIGRTIILTFEKGQVQEEVAQVFRETSDLHLSCELDLAGGASARRLIVTRLSRAQGRFGDVIGFRTEPGVGLVVEIRTVV